MRRSILNVVLIMVILVQISCHSSSFKDEIKLTYEEIFSKCPFITEFRFYKSNRKKVIVNVIEVAKNPKLFADRTIKVQFNYRNNDYVIVAFERYDYRNNKYYLFNGDKSLQVFSKTLEKNELLSNHKKNIYRQKNTMYFEDSFYLPYLGLKHLENLRKNKTNNSYFSPNISTGRGFSLVLDLYKPIAAEITIEKMKVTEKYRDSNDCSLTRILEPGESINLNNLDEVERYANQMLEKYAVLAE